LNHPLVRPWVADASEGALDLSARVADRRNILLLGEHGGVMFYPVMPGVYEAHTQVLPAGRGGWTRGLTQACAHWMFTRSPAYEIMTRVPQGHFAAKAATEATGMHLEFTRPKECRFRGQLVDVHIYSGRLQDWIGSAPGLVEIGARFHDRLNELARAAGITAPAHEPDENHNRYVGAAIEMARGGQVKKGVAFYNRWAIVARHPMVELVAIDPPTIKMDIGTLRLTGDDVDLVVP
jgi:hypothetical protein